MTNPWITRPSRKASAKLRLFCLPHAGGNAWSFRKWWSRMPDEIEVCGVQLPGHGNRIRETPLEDFRAVLEGLAEALHAEVKQPYALFGHSLGALLAFELARLFRHDPGIEPSHLFVSGHNAPQMPDDLEDVSVLDDAALIDRVRRLNCTPEEAIQDDELMQLMLPVIRADFAVRQSYVYEDAERLGCPLTALGGLWDPRTDADGLGAWREHTAGPFAVRQFPGDHFFVFSEEELVVRTVAADLNCVVNTSRPG